jgi:hypothetical protein
MWQRDKFGRRCPDGLRNFVSTIQNTNDTVTGMAKIISVFNTARNSRDHFEPMVTAILQMLNIP